MVPPPEFVVEGEGWRVVWPSDVALLLAPDPEASLVGDEMTEVADVVPCGFGVLSRIIRRDSRSALL